MDFINSAEINDGINGYATLSRELLDRYRNKQTKRYHREMLTTLRKTHQEGIEDFTDRVRKVNSNTYEQTNDAARNEYIRQEADQRALDCFLLGLEGEIGKFVRMQLPTTLTSGR